MPAYFATEFGTGDFPAQDTGGGPNLCMLPWEPLFNEDLYGAKAAPGDWLRTPEKYGSNTSNEGYFGPGPYPSSVNGVQVTHPSQLTIPWNGKSRLLYRGFMGSYDGESENARQTRKVFGRSLLPNNEK